ncbi:annexin A8 isoform X1 [Symphalangus syndactylus]|uniref:annexin A8 isoform X1 n=1 Tax=Symphalangus syndactylus TaxID=9590 RepID=UPI0030076487
MAWWKAWIEQEGVTVKSSSHFNPDPDAETLYKAMKGIGTNKQAVIDVLTKRSNAQRQQIAKSFKAQFGKDLTETLKSELSGKFERLIVALMYPPYRYEAKELHDSMKGLGTKEGVIIEILASRTKNQLREIMKAYEEDYGSSLEEDIQADTSGYLERILVCLLQGSRDDVSSFVDPGLALQDAQDLYAAGEKIRGTDEMKFITILCTRSATHLLRVFEEYEKIANKSIEDSIKSETHGSLEEAMLTVGRHQRRLQERLAEPGGQRPLRHRRTTAKTRSQSLQDSSLNLGHGRRSGVVGRSQPFSLLFPYFQCFPAGFLTQRVELAWAPLPNFLQVISECEHNANLSVSPARQMPRHEWLGDLWVIPSSLQELPKLVTESPGHRLYRLQPHSHLLKQGLHKRGQGIWVFNKCRTDMLLYQAAGELAGSPFVLEHTSFSS